MAYRRRDAPRYSSADAYRSLHNPANTHNARDAHPLPPLPPANMPAARAAPSSSSEEETALNPRGRADTPSPPGYERDRDESPLSPPRPHFLGGRARKNSAAAAAADRRSWSSAGDSLEPASDSDTAGTDREGQPAAGLAGIGARRDVQAQAQGPIMSRRVRAHAAGSSHTQVAVVAAASASPSASTTAVRPRNHHRRRSSETQTPSSPTSSQSHSQSSQSHAHSQSSQSSHTRARAGSPNMAGVGAGAAQANPFDTPVQTPVSPGSPISPSSPGLDRDRDRTARGAPPSAFPFLSHTGNPDPGTPLPASSALARRPSHESFRRQSLSYQPATPGFPVTPGTGAGATGYSALRGSMDVTAEEDAGLGRPYAPFMGEGDAVRQSWVSNNAPAGVNSVYKNSAAAALTGSNPTLAGESPIPRTSSQPQIAMRAPFLSPSSRPTSSLWSPPSYPSLPAAGQPLTAQYPPSLTYLPGSSNPYLVPRKAKPPMPSSRLAQKLSAEEKPWTQVRDRRERCAWWATFLVCWIGVAVSAVIIFMGWTGVHQLKPDQICLVLDEEFDAGALDNSTWNLDVELGGFGNGEFEMTTDSATNLFFKNGELYLMPTLTTDTGISLAQVVGNTSYTYALAGCTAGQAGSSDNSSQANCTATSGAGNAIPPVMSARLNTKGKVTIGYGKVEVRAKLPTGDWLWPAIWMLPQNTSKYGPWPLSGEIDIMEARGNPQSYPAQGVNFVRSSLNYGVLDTLQTNLIGWWQEKRFTYAEGFHTYSLEWTPDWMRFYVDSRLQAMMNIKITGKGGKSFFERAGYPPTAHDDAGDIVPVTDIWADAGGGAAAPFDQQFYLILDLAAGGTSGWFPDNVGGKPWFDNSASAMVAFAEAQDTWAATWPSDEDDRAFRIDYVKMWSLKQNGQCPS